jgi:hypothetical protein
MMPAKQVLAFRLAVTGLYAGTDESWANFMAAKYELDEKLDEYYIRYKS